MIKACLLNTDLLIIFKKYIFYQHMISQDQKGKGVWYTWSGIWRNTRNWINQKNHKVHIKKIHRIIYDAYRLQKTGKNIEPWIYCRRVNRIKDRLLDFVCVGLKNKNWARISKRILKYYDEILTFLEEPDIVSDNNHAERMIRPNVILRKISFQNMSEKGAKAHEVLMSLLQTIRLQNKDPQEFFKKAYLKHRQGNVTPILST